jgi:hypothetical protein
MSPTRPFGWQRFFWWVAKPAGLRRARGELKFELGFTANISRR